VCSSDLLGTMKVAIVWIA